MHSGSSKLIAALALLSAISIRADPPTCPERVDCTAAPAVTEQTPDQDGSIPGPYPDVAAIHELRGTASYYSGFFEGRATASGEVFHQAGNTAAHLTLPLGTLVEVKSLHTGRKVRVRINDRGPYTGGFVIDLTKSCARFLGVDTARDRRVTLRIVALPGKVPHSEETVATAAQ